MLPEIRRSFRNTKRSRLHTEAMASLRRESERKCIGVSPFYPPRRGIRTFHDLKCSTDTFGYRAYSLFATHSAATRASRKSLPHSRRKTEPVSRGAYERYP